MLRKNNVSEILDIKYSNKHWQVMELPGATVYLYAAYFDTREVYHENYKTVKYAFRL